MLSGDTQPPEVKAIEVASGSVGAWKLFDKTVDKNGKTLSTLPSWMIDCEPGPPNSRQREVSPKTAACFQRFADEGYRQHIRYFEANRFWDLQWREFGFFMLLALALTGFSFWRIRRDLS